MLRMLGSSILVVVTTRRWGFRYLYKTERSPRTFPMEAGGVERVGVINEIMDSESGGVKTKVCWGMLDYMAS